jgi:hypothetical protein
MDGITGQIPWRFGVFDHVPDGFNQFSGDGGFFFLAIFVCFEPPVPHAEKSENLLPKAPSVFFPIGRDSIWRACDH